MKKEVIIAIISGLVLGLIITIGIYTANRSLQQQKLKKITDNQQTVQPTPQTNNQKTLRLTSPEPFDLIDQSEITLSGAAWPNAVIAVLTENDNFMAQADSEGIFSFKIELIKGFNEITVIATDETGESQTVPLVLTYSTTKITLDEQPTQDTEENQ